MQVSSEKKNAARIRWTRSQLGNQKTIDDRSKRGKKKTRKTLLLMIVYNGLETLNRFTRRLIFLNGLNKRKFLTYIGQNATETAETATSTTDTWVSGRNVGGFRIR